MKKEFLKEYNSLNLKEKIFNKCEKEERLKNTIIESGKYVNNSFDDLEKVHTYYLQNCNRETYELNTDSINIEDKWIISKMNKLIKQVTKDMENRDYSNAIEKIYDFTCKDFCSNYIGITKARVNGKDDTEKTKTSFVLINVYGNILKMMYPFLPDETSKIYKEMMNKPNELMEERWPNAMENMGYDKEENLVQSLIDGITDRINRKSNKTLE